ncbi:MAG: hypothetical protein HY922_16070 [Elusimicrobia bacterium]|nr:hypothetical protein [Elusimicrobiota bacterium]
MAQMIRVPFEVFEKLQEIVILLENSVSPYRPEFLARMYRARASDLEGRGKTLQAIQRKFAS